MKELNEKELREVEGGIWILPVVIAYIGGIISGGLAGELILDGPKKCYEDFMAGLNDR